VSHRDVRACFLRVMICHCATAESAPAP
jgi:hypothetical protein